MTTRMTVRPRTAALPLLALALVLAAPPALRAEAPARPAPVAAPAPAFAAVLGVKSVFSFTNRSNIVRLCILAMCLALFILMRKFGGPARR